MHETCLLRRQNSQYVRIFDFLQQRCQRVAIIVVYRIQNCSTVYTVHFEYRPQLLRANNFGQKFEREFRIYFNNKFVPKLKILISRYQPDSIREVIVPNLFLIQINDQRMYGNLVWLIYFCKKIHPISAQRVFVNCQFVVYFINTKKMSRIGSYFGQKIITI